jgi:lauroyl/myristoyl acyltransferase
MVRASAERWITAVRRHLPDSLVPVVVQLAFWVLWSRASVREDARAQMRFLLEKTQPDADLEAKARAYVKRNLWRGEARWHPDLVTRQRVVGLEHLQAAQALGRGVVLSYMHHGSWDGSGASIARLGLPQFMTAYPTTLSPDAPAWIQQHVKVCCIGGGVALSTEIGTQGIIDLLSEGKIVSIAVDVAGRTPVRFVGRDLTGSFGAARIPTLTGSPLVAMTHQVDAQGEFVRVHEPLDPADFESPQALLVRLLEIHEAAVLETPEDVDVPLSRWRVAEAATTG